MAVTLMPSLPLRPASRQPQFLRASRGDCDSDHAHRFSFRLFRSLAIRSKIIVNKKAQPTPPTQYQRASLIVFPFVQSSKSRCARTTAALSTQAATYASRQSDAIRAWVMPTPHRPARRPNLSDTLGSGMLFIVNPSSQVLATASEFRRLAMPLLSGRPQRQANRFGFRRG